MAASDLYPSIEPFEAGRLAVTPPHEIRWERCGKQGGQPVVFLHGGPGAGAAPDHRRFFDPKHFEVMLFDQRGAGKSTPLGETVENTTQALIADIEQLRQMMGAEKWLVFGGSWGSTLALAYAQAYPERVSGLILRGIFLGTAAEVDWFLHGMGRFQPEARRDFLAAIPERERGDLLAAYAKRLFDRDPKVHQPAAHAWSVYEGRCATLLPSPETVSTFGQSDVALALARLECHYFANGCFLDEGEILGKIDRIRAIPAAFVQGRYDIICPPEAALRLSEAWPEARLTVVPDAGHSAMEPGIRQALIRALEHMKS